MSFISQTTLVGPKVHIIVYYVIYHGLEFHPHRSFAHMQKKRDDNCQKIIKCEGKYTLKMAMPYFEWVCKDNS